MSAAELGQKVKAKYPGEYDHLQDEELAHKVIAKYPEYGDVVRPSGVTKPNIDMQPESTPADYAKSAIRMGVNAFTGTPGAVSTKEMSGQPGAGDLASQGASELGTQGKRLRGALDIANAGMDIATPALGPAALESPVAVGRTVLGGVAGQTGARKAANALGASPDVAEAAGDLGGLAGGVIAAPGVASGAVRLAARTGEAAANQKLIPLRAIANLGTPADEAAALKVKLPGRDAGLPKAPEFPGAKLPARPDAKFLKQNIATPMQEGSSVLPPAVNAPPVTGRPSTRLVLTPEEFAAKDVMGPIKQRLASENGMHYAAMGKAGKLPMKTGASPIAVPESAARVIPGKATVIPAPSSEAFGPQPEGFVTPGNDDMTELLRQSLAIKNGKIAVPGEGEPAAEFERRGAPRGIQPEADQAYLATLEQKIANNAPDRLQAIQARTDLLNRMNGVQVPPTDVASRAQAGLTRKMSQPRAEVTAPAATRKDLNMTEKDFLNLRKNLRTKSGL